MSSYPHRRRVVRFIWDFYGKPVEATKLPVGFRWFKKYPFVVEKALVELVGQEGKIHLGFRWRPSLRRIETGDIIKLIYDDLMPDANGQRYFERVLYSWHYEGHYDGICVEIQARNGEHFTYTAMARCRTLFERLGMNVENTLPLVGNFTQESVDRRSWMDFGTSLYLDVFRNMPMLRSLPVPRDHAT